jgi:hypothetical protein
VIECDWSLDALVDADEGVDQPIPETDFERRFAALPDMSRAQPRQMGAPVRRARFSGNQWNGAPGPQISKRLAAALAALLLRQFDSPARYPPNAGNQVIGAKKVPRNSRKPPLRFILQDRRHKTPCPMAFPKQPAHN